MLAVAEPIPGIETEVSNPTPVITTLYDLIAALQDQAEPWEEDVVTAAVVDFCNSGQVRFLDMPKDCHLLCT